MGIIVIKRPVNYYNNNSVGMYEAEVWITECPKRKTLSPFLSKSEHFYGPTYLMNMFVCNKLRANNKQLEIVRILPVISVCPVVDRRRPIVSADVVIEVLHFLHLAWHLRVNAANAFLRRVSKKTPAVVEAYARGIFYRLFASSYRLY